MRVFLVTVIVPVARDVETEIPASAIGPVVSVPERVLADVDDPARRIGTASAPERVLEDVD